MQKLCKLSILIFSTLLSSIADTHAFNSVCYYNNEAIDYTDSTGAIPAPIYPSNIDATLCTHFVYAYAIINQNTSEITSNNVENDVTQNRYLEFTGLRAKNSKAKFLLALGGWEDSNDKPGKYSNVVKSTANINKLVNSTVLFLKEYKFDGLSFDWLYPNSTEDFAGYTALVIALKTAFKQDNLLLTSTVSALQNYIDGYNVSVLNNYLDFVNLATFDYYTPDSSPTIGRHSAPLYSPPNDPPAASLTVDYSVQYWLAKGLSPRLINLGIPLFSQTWAMTSTNTAPYLQPVATSGGFASLMYSDICDNLRKGQLTDGKMDTTLNISSYAYNLGNFSFWTSYDSAAAVASKFVYAVKNGLGGVALFEIAQDDVKNVCGGGPYPIVNLVSTLSNGVTSSTTRPVTSSTRLPPGKKSEALSYNAVKYDWKVAY